MCPIYDYRCKNKECEHEFDLWVPTIQDKKTTKCPECGQRAKKVPSINARMKANWSMHGAMG